MSTNQKEVKKKIKATLRNSEVFPKTSHLNFTRHAINSDTNPSLLSQSLFHSSTKTRDGKTKENFDSINLLDSNNEKMNELNSDKYEETKQHLDSNVVANYLRFDTEQASDKTYSIISNASSQSSFESVNNYDTNEIEFTEKAKNFSRFGLSDSDINYHYNSDAYKYDRSLRNQLVTYDLVEELAKCIRNVNSTALNKTVQNSNSSSGSSSDTSSSYLKTDDESWSYYSSSGDLITKSSSHTPFSSSQNLSSKDDTRDNQSWSFSTNDFDDQSNNSAEQKTCTQVNNVTSEYSTSSEESSIIESSTQDSNNERLKKNQTNQQNIDPRQLLEELFNSSERYRKQPYIGDWKEIEKIIEKCSDLKGIHTALSEHSRNNQGKRIHPEFLSFLSTLVNENEKTNHQSNITFFTELPDNSSEIIYSSNSSSSDDSDSDDFEIIKKNNENELGQIARFELFHNSKSLLSKKAYDTIANKQTTSAEKVKAIFDNYANGNSFFHPKRKFTHEVGLCLQANKYSGWSLASTVGAISSLDKGKSTLKSSLTRRLIYTENCLNYKEHLKTENEQDIKDLVKTLQLGG